MRSASNCPRAELSARGVFAVRLVLPSMLLSAVLLIIAGFAPGCGGGGGGTAPPSPPPPPPPAVEIGPGPGPASATVGAEPGVSTAAARGAPLATDPRAELVRPAAIARLDALADDPPTTEVELRALLADFTGWVTQQPNDAASQAGLALLIAFAGAYNAGVEAGYPPADLLTLLDPVVDFASSGSPAPGILGSTRVMRPAQGWFDPMAPDFSSADLQIAVRSLWLPALDEAIVRVQALVDNAAGPGVPLLEIGGRRPWTAYRAEAMALVGLLRVLKGALLTACAWQFNPGQWDWTVPLAERDADDSGLLTVGEYLPPDPFLWRHDSPTMRSGGAAIRNGIETLVAAVEARRPGSLLELWVAGGAGSERLQRLRDLQALLGEEVQAQVLYGATGPEQQRTVTVNLRRAWDDPVDDLKELFPTLRPVSGSVWQALPRNADDFPDPSFGGVFPGAPTMANIIATGPSYLALRYGEAEVVLVDRRR